MRADAPCDHCPADRTTLLSARIRLGHSMARHKNRAVVRASLAWTFALLPIVSSCGLQVDRAAAIEACFRASTLNSPIENPRAGELVYPYTPQPDDSRQRRSDSSYYQPWTPNIELLPPVQPRLIAPTSSQMRENIAFVRSRSASSRDRGLVKQADALFVQDDENGRLSVNASEMMEYCQRRGY